MNQPDDSGQATPNTEQPFEPCRKAVDLPDGTGWSRCIRRMGHDGRHSTLNDRLNGPEPQPHVLQSLPRAGRNPSGLWLELEQGVSHIIPCDEQTARRVIKAVNGLGVIDRG